MYVGEVRLRIDGIRNSSLPDNEESNPEEDPSAKIIIITATAIATIRTMAKVSIAGIMIFSTYAELSVCVHRAA